MQKRKCLFLPQQVIFRLVRPEEEIFEFFKGFINNSNYTTTSYVPIDNNSSSNVIGTNTQQVLAAYSNLIQSLPVNSSLLYYIGKTEQEVRDRAHPRIVNPSKRYAFHILLEKDIDFAKKDEICVLDCPVTVFKQMIAHKDDYDFIESNEKGGNWEDFVWQIDKKGKGLQTKYTVTMIRKDKPSKEQLDIISTIEEGEILYAIFNQLPYQKPKTRLDLLDLD